MFEVYTLADPRHSRVFAVLIDGDTPTKLTQRAKSQTIAITNAGLTPVRTVVHTTSSEEDATAYAQQEIERWPRKQLTQKPACFRGFDVDAYNLTAYEAHLDYWMDEEEGEYRRRAYSI